MRFPRDSSTLFFWCTPKNFNLCFTMSVNNGMKNDTQKGIEHALIHKSTDYEKLNIQIKSQKCDMTKLHRPLE